MTILSTVYYEIIVHNKLSYIKECDNPFWNDHSTKLYLSTTVRHFN